MKRRIRAWSQMWVLVMALIGLICLGGIQSVLAQIDQGAITGTIMDTSGAVVQGASITLINQETSLSFTTKSGNRGEYRFGPIKIGLYSITVSAPNFETRKQENIRVNVSETVGMNLTLKPGTVGETVVVTTNAEIQTEDASTGEVFTAKEINDMPLSQRNYVFAAQLTTGVAAPNQGFRQVAGAGDFTSNGGRVSQNNFVLDGVDNNSNMQDFLNGATYAVRPPPDALAEFKVQSSDYAAELGHSTGAAVNASIKSGTNAFHGSLYEFLQNDRMDAADYFNRTGKTAHHFNQFGGSIGGPILRNKLFFFFDAQGTRISSFVPSIPNRTVPTDLMRSGNFTELLDAAKTDGNGTIPLYLPGGNVTSGIGAVEAPNVTQRYLMCNGVRNVICNPNPAAVALLKLYPEPNAGVSGQTAHNFTVPATAFTNNTTQYDVRVDYNVSNKDQVFGRYSYSDNPQSTAPPLGSILDGGGFGTGHNTNSGKSWALGETHFFNSTTANEFRAGFNWLHGAYLQENANNARLAASYGLGGLPTGPSLGGLPSINFGGAGAPNGFGVAWYEPSDEKQNVFQVNDNFSKTLGRHFMKVGVNFQHVRFYGLQPPQGIGTENFSGTFTSDPGAPSGQNTGFGVADFLLDNMHDSSLTTVTPFTDLRWYTAAYAQDDWKVTPHLTLNFGLRWEYTQPIRELHDGQANFVGNYLPFNQGTGTYLIPKSQTGFPVAQTLLNTFAADHITVQYTSNQSLVNPRKANFAPRLGVAYAFNPRTVVRAGAGLFYGGFENIGLGLNLANNAPFFVSAGFYPTPNQCYNTIATGVVCPTNGQTLETGFGAAATSPAALANASGIGTIYANDQNAKTAVTTSYNLTLERALSGTMSFTIGYQGNQSKHLRMSYGTNNYNGAVPVGANGQDYQPFHDFYIVNVASQGIGRYDSLQAKFNKRYSNGLSFTTGYTWAHCLDDAFGPIGQSQYGGYRNPVALGFRYDYGACTQDVRSRFTFATQYELPFGHGKRFLNQSGLVDAVVGGWKTSFIFQAQAGNPIFLNSSNQGGSYPILTGDPFEAGGTASSATQPNFQCATKTRTLEQWFNPCAFINPPQSTLGATDPANNLINAASAGLLPFGSRGRQSVIGPGFNRLDMSLFKSFALPFHESSLQLRADAFNLLNRPSFGNPGNGLSGSGNQAITQTRFSGIGSLPDARVIQVGARLSF